jgi:hypothetical protein
MPCLRNEELGDQTFRKNIDPRIILREENLRVEGAAAVAIEMAQVAA